MKTIHAQKGQVLVEGVIAVTLLVTASIVLLTTLSLYGKRAWREFEIESNSVYEINAGRVRSRSSKFNRGKTRKFKLHSEFRSFDEAYLRF